MSNVLSSVFTKFLGKLLFRKGFYQTIFFLEHVSVALSVFFVPCELETLDLAAFLNIFLYINPTMKSAAIS